MSGAFQYQLQNLKQWVLCQNKIPFHLNQLMENIYQGLLITRNLFTARVIHMSLMAFIVARSRRTFFGYTPDLSNTKGGETGTVLINGSHSWRY